MSGNNHPSWERLGFWLVATVVALQVLAAVLPRLLPSLAILGIVAAALRLIWFYTNRY